jgi:hypothetical protein
MNHCIVHTNILTKIVNWNNVLIVNVTITSKDHVNTNNVARFARIRITIVNAQRWLKNENASIAMKIILFNYFNAR